MPPCPREPGVDEAVVVEEIDIPVVHIGLDIVELNNSIGVGALKLPVAPRPTAVELAPAPVEVALDVGVGGVQFEHLRTVGEGGGLRGDALGADCPALVCVEAAGVVPGLELHRFVA